MSATLVLGSGAVVASLGVLWWALSGPRVARAPINLTDGVPLPVTDLRAMALQRGTLERVLAAKVLLGGTGAVLGVLRFVVAPGGLGVILAMALAAFGWFGPDLVLRHKAEQRQELVRRTLADAIDQLTVTVQAGLGLDAAIARVSRRTRGPLGDELARVGQDVRAGMSRSAALAAMAERVQVPELRHVVLALAQAERLGVPVAKTLQVQAHELRIKRRQHAEEQAMKLPVKILFPTVLCILPTTSPEVEAVVAAG